MKKETKEEILDGWGLKEMRRAKGQDARGDKDGDGNDEVQDTMMADVKRVKLF
jgi:hypothetical protein